MSACQIRRISVSFRVNFTKLSALIQAPTTSGQPPITSVAPWKLGRERESRVSSAYRWYLISAYWVPFFWNSTTTTTTLVTCPHFWTFSHLLLHIGCLLLTSIILFPTFCSSTASLLQPCPLPNPIPDRSSLLFIPIPALEITCV